MRKSFIILTGLLLTLLFTACKQFTADIDNYLGYWSAEAFVTDSTVKAVVQSDLNSIPSVPSENDVSVTFKLNNPKSFQLDLPPQADAEKNVIVFERLAQAPKEGRDYTLIQSEDRQSLILTYKSFFLKAHEWGEQDLSSTLTLWANGRKFKQTYTFRVKANTPPPKPIFTVAKTTDTPAYYVLCISVPDMDKKVQGSKLLHKDITGIEVNGTSYPVSVNEAENKFNKLGSDVFIDPSSVAKLKPDAADLPSDSSWVLYYKTDVKVEAGAVQKDYTVRLTDEKGLVSGILKASTQPNQAKAEQVAIAEGEYFGSGTGDNATDPIKIGTKSSEAKIRILCETSNTTVHCTLTEWPSGSPSQPTGNPVTVTMPLGSDVEKTYKLEYYTDGEGFAATAKQTRYYKVVKKHEVTFNANGGTPTPEVQYVAHGEKAIEPTAAMSKADHTFGGWYKDPACSTGQEWDFLTATVNGDITLYALWHKDVTVTFEVKDGVGGSLKGTYNSHPIQTKTTNGGTPETLTIPYGGSVTFTAEADDGWEVDGWTGVTANTPNTTASLTVTGNATVQVKFKPGVFNFQDGPNAWKRLREEAEKEKGAHTIVINGEIKATGGDDKDEIKPGRDLTIKSATSAVLNANSLSRIFHVQDGKTLTLENIELKNGKAPVTEDGGGIYSEGTLTLKNTIIEGCGAANGGGILVKEGGKAELKNCTVKACEAAEKGGGIYSLGEVTLDASTIGGSSASDGNKAKRGGGISLEKGTIDVSAGSCIQHNQTVGSSGIEAGGGGIFIRYGKLTLRGTVSDNTALNGTAFVLGGGVYVGAKGEFIMETGAIISGNTSKFGGGVYIDVVSAGAGAFTMKGGTISGCKAGDSAFLDAQGGGVYIKADGTKQGIFTMEGGSITGCTAEATNAGGGGIYADSGAVFKMSGGAVITPSTQTNTSTVKYNDVYLEGTASDNAKITVNGTLTGTAPVARITVGDNNYKYSTQVLDGDRTTGSPKNYTKFTVTSKVLEDGIAEIWKIRANGNLEKSKYMDVRYDKLAHYLSSAYPSSHAVEGINYIKITGTIPADDLRDYIYPSSGGRLAKTIQYAHKKVALKLPDSIPELTTMYNCFTKCEYLVSLENIPSGVRSMAECFKGCKNLTKAPVIPDSVDNMEECFQSCEALKEAPAIPSGVTAIKSCFNGCKELTKAPSALPLGVTDIYACFAGCEKLTKAPAIPSGVKEIEHCFDGCKALTQGPDIPSTVTNIQKCFKGCTNLKKVTLNCVYGSGPAFSDIFKDCTSLDNGGIKVPSGQLQTYKDNAGNMGTTADKFSRF